MMATSLLPPCWWRGTWSLWMRWTDRPLLPILPCRSSTWMITWSLVYQPSISLWCHASECCLSSGITSAGNVGSRILFEITSCDTVQMLMLLWVLLQPGPSGFCWPKFSDRAGPVPQPADESTCTAHQRAEGSTGKKQKQKNTVHHIDYGPGLCLLLSDADPEGKSLELFLSAAEHH